MPTPKNHQGNMAALQQVAGEIAEEYYDTYYPKITGEDRKDSIGWFTGRTGPVGITKITEAVLRLKSESAEKILPLLPWVIEDVLSDNPYDQADVVEAAIRQPFTHETLKPFLADILQAYSSEKKAQNFIGLTRAIAKTNNDEFKQMAKTHALEALKRTSWAPTNFAIVACAHLDMGGKVEDLSEGLALILDGQEDDKEGALFFKTKQEKTNKHLCGHGFIKLLNHPEFQNFKKNHPILQHLAGTQINDKTEKNKPTVVMVNAVEDNGTNASQIFFKPWASYTETESPEQISTSFVRNASQIAQTSLDLFNQLAQTPRKDVARPARNAANELKKAMS